MQTLETVEIAKSYRGRRVVNDVSLSVKRGEIVGLLGPNGAGKTTTISILCGLFPATKGSVVIDGIDSHVNLEQIKQIIGVVPQDIALYPTLTGRENLTFQCSCIILM